MITDEISTLMERLRLTSDQIEEISNAISTCTDDTRRDALTVELTALQTTERATKTTLFEEWNKTKTSTDSYDFDIRGTPMSLI